MSASPRAKVAEARRLRGEGKTYVQIAALLDTTKGTARRWADPDAAEKDRRDTRAWRQRNKGTCVDCGAPTNCSAGLIGRAERCESCHHAKQRAEARWTPETCVEAMRAWAEKHGRAPRSHPDWTNAGPDHPSTTTVVVIIGWNECLGRAGLPVIHHSRTAQHITNDELVALYAAGLTFKEIAEWHSAGSPSNVYQRIVAHGGVEIRRGFNVFTEMEIKRAKRMYAEGHGTTAIASATGHQHSAVRRMLVREGVALRSRTEAQRARRKAAA